MESQNQVYGLPRLNEPAPNFAAIRPRAEDAGGLQGPLADPLLASRRFHAGLHHGVRGLAKAYKDFQAIGCDLLGLSIDSVYSHLAWTRNIKEKFGVEIPFPVIDDLSMSVAKAYGMIHPEAGDTSAVRATFVIDPEGVLRAMVYYPMTNGRS
jgi:peroxiredoxin (alkyl hydroperoxide reductase subunit C)